MQWGTTKKYPPPKKKNICSPSAMSQISFSSLASCAKKAGKDNWIQDERLSWELFPSERKPSEPGLKGIWVGKWHSHKFKGQVHWTLNWSSQVKTAFFLKLPCRKLHNKTNLDRAAELNSPLYLVHVEIISVHWSALCYKLNFQGRKRGKKCVKYIEYSV